VPPAAEHVATHHKAHEGLGATTPGATAPINEPPTEGDSFMIKLGTLSPSNPAATAIAAALVLGWSAAATAQTVDGPRVEWKLAMWGKPRALTQGIETLKKHVEERTGGKFTINIGYESYGGPKEFLDLLKIGAIQAAVVCPSYHPDKLPAMGVLDLPFLPLADLDAQTKAHEAVLAHPAILKEFAGWNTRPYMTTLVPQYEFVGKGKVPKSIDDFKGMRVRALGGLGEAMRRIGAVPTTVDATEVYTALERGTVDAVSFPTTYAHQSYKTYEIGKWYTENLSPGTVGCPTVFNIDAWNKLPPAYKALTEEAKPMGYANMKAAYKSADEKNIPLFKRTLTFVKFSDADLEKFREFGGKPVWDDWAAKAQASGLPGKELIDLVIKTAKQ
jgi:TRAP-type C4-dicarboxylate transport system substrate-binding protein